MHVPMKLEIRTTGRGRGHPGGASPRQSASSNTPIPAHPQTSALKLLLLALLGLAACDSAEPEATVLVVETVLRAEAEVGAVTVRQTGALDAPYAPEGVAGVSVTLRLERPRGGATVVDFAHIGGGRYQPTDRAVLSPGASFTLDVAAPPGSAATPEVGASGRIPPPIRLADLALRIPEAPVSTVVLDSLRLPLDSLGVGTSFGFVYLIEAALSWESDAAIADGPDEALWVQARLDPVAATASSALQFFLLPEDVRRETDHAAPAPGLRAWTGVYAIPVETEDAPLPPHRLRAALVRSYADYANYVATRNVPTRREPVSNIRGGLGLAAAIALDSVSVLVER